VFRTPELRTFAGHSRSGAASPTAKARPDFRDFVNKTGGRTVLSDRATTGFGGLIAVTAILLAVQTVTGVGAFPL
jgi:hypothetical protein